MFRQDRVVAIQGRRRCVNNSLDPGVTACEQEVQSPVHICSMGGHWIEDGFGNRGYCCLMDHVIGAGEELRQVFTVSNICFDDFSALFEYGDVFAFPGGKIIDDSRRFAAAEQFLDNVRSDKSSTARNDINCHRYPPALNDFLKCSTAQAASEILPHLDCKR